MDKFEHKTPEAHKEATKKPHVENFHLKSEATKEQTKQALDQFKLAQFEEKATTPAKKELASKENVQKELTPEHKQVQKTLKDWEELLKEKPLEHIQSSLDAYNADSMIDNINKKTDNEIRQKWGSQFERFST